jgi:hypothetical protein
MVCFVHYIIYMYRDIYIVLSLVLLIYLLRFFLAVIGEVLASYVVWTVLCYKGDKNFSV